MYTISPIPPRDLRMTGNCLALRASPCITMACSCRTTMPYADTRPTSDIRITLLLMERLRSPCRIMATRARRSAFGTSGSESCRKLYWQLTTMTPFYRGFFCAIAVRATATRRQSEFPRPAVGYSRTFSSTLRKSIGCPSLCSAIKPEVNGLPGRHSDVS